MLQTVLSIFLLLSAVPAFSQVITGLSHPESVLIKQNSIFVSDMGVSTSSRDRDGNIFKYDLKGLRDNTFRLKESLTSPMGMALLNGVLYVADVDKVVGVSAITGDKLVEFDLSDKKATFLNDIVIIEKRYLLVTATTLKKIFRIDLITHSIKEMKFDLLGAAPNGITYDARKSLVYIAANRKHELGDYRNGSVLAFYVNGKANRTRLIEQNYLGKFLDGIALKKGTIIVSDWYDRGTDGRLYYLEKKTLELKTEQVMGTAGLADFDYSEREKLLVTPDLVNGKVYITTIKNNYGRD